MPEPQKAFVTNLNGQIDQNGKDIGHDDESTDLARNKIAVKSETGELSEHGHNIFKVRPLSDHSGADITTFFNGLFQTIIGVSTLGASVTFSFVLSNDTSLAKPTAYYTSDQVIIFLATSWLLFLLALAFASLFSTLLTFFRDHWIRDLDGKHGKTSQSEVYQYALFVCVFMGSLIIAAFVLLCLVVVSYVPAVGWTALGFTVAFGLLIVASIFWQAPRGKKTKRTDTGVVNACA